MGRSAWLIGLALVTSSIHAGDGPALNVEDPATSSSADRYVRLHRIERETQSVSESAQRDAITDAYSRLFSGSTNPEALHQAQDQDLADLLKAAHTAAFYSHHPDHLRDLQRIFSELERRGRITPEQTGDMFRSLITYRQFDEARKLSSRYPEFPLEPVPEIKNAGTQPDHYNAFAVEGEALGATTIDIMSGDHLVIIAHPLCSFSRNAKRDIDADPKLAHALSPKAIWLAPVSGRLHLDTLKSWNKNNPEAHILMARTRADWALIDEWSTPQFYAVRDGVVIGKVTGWPKEGRLRELEALLFSLNDPAETHP